MEKTARGKIVDYLNANDLRWSELAADMGVGRELLIMIAEGEVTHPEIAKKIGTFLNLTELETEELMPLHHRPHGGSYEPDKFVMQPDMARNLYGKPLES